jgi:hypothetical protein
MDELFSGVVAPLVLGGDVCPPRPVGAGLADRIADLADVFEASDRGQWRAALEARARRARALWPVDDLAPPGAHEWRMVAALSDLLQVANPQLASVFADRRRTRLLVSIEAALGQIPRVTSAREALVRHATFARVPELARLDRAVRWWTGSATFLGTAPPDRLLAWPSLRRVSVDETRTGLGDLPAHVHAHAHRWSLALADWLSRTPLTDLTWARREPASTSAAELARLGATPAGARLLSRVQAGRGRSASTRG